MSKWIVIIKADTNDADYVHSINELDKEDIILDGTHIKTWNSLREISNYYNVPYHVVINYLIGKNKTTEFPILMDYKWKKQIEE